LTISIVIVVFEEGPELVVVLDELTRQCGDGDEVIVVHNTSRDGTARRAARHPGVTRVIETGANPGFGRAANLGAAEASGDAILFLNPDAVPEPGFLDALRAPPDGWDAWMGLVALADGAHVNTAGGVLHFLGFGWTGRYGEPVEAIGADPEEVGFLSGACVCVRRDAWRETGGFAESFFLYVEDVDLSHRLRLAGRRFGVLPTARVRHDYEFSKGTYKLRELERNRWLSILRCYPPELLALVLPALVLLELPLLAYAATHGWGRAKLGAMASVVGHMPRVLRERREVQNGAVVSAADFARPIRAELGSPFFGAAARSPAVTAVLRAYWWAVRRALGLLRR
jgi:GT2 family glycosyltransferase